MIRILFKFIQKARGQSLIELLLAVGVTAVLIPILIGGLITSREGKVQKDLRLQAIGYMKESQEAIRSIREEGWINIASNGTFYPRKQSDNSWELVSGSQTINGTFSRTVAIEDVYRNPTGTIVLVPTPGVDTVDPSTKKITSSVSWGGSLPSSVSSPLYLTRFLENNAFTETTQAHFNLGSKSGVSVKATTPSTTPDDGEVILGPGGGPLGDWCGPNLSIAALDLPKSGVANALSAIEGQAFAGTGDNASGVSFANISINTTTPGATIVATFDGYKTNGVFGETNYAYLATDTNSKEIVIINLTAFTDPPTNSKYKEEGYFNAPGNGSGTSIYVSGAIGYMTSGDRFHTFDLSSKSGARPIKDPDGVTLPGQAVKMTVVGNYAYVALSGSTQLQIVDISDPLNLSLKGYLGINNAGDGRDIFVNQTGTVAYLALSTSTQKEVYAINIATKTGDLSSSIIGSYEANGMNPKGVTAVTSNKAIVVGIGAEEYQVFDTVTFSRCGGLNIDTGINGVSSVVQSNGYAYSYIITGDATSEFKIIEGGAGTGGGYTSSGTFESQSLLFLQSAFNRLIVNAVKPLNTTIEYQIAVADANPVTNDCNGVAFTFVGPDGTNGTKFLSSGPIPLNDDGAGYENPARCFKYKVFLNSTDSTATPVFQDITVNYSP